jgi:tetratricopeptide (TPR) repeat protein
VGRENYGRHYLRYKLIEAPEEVANPHNLFVQAAADWGALGLIGVVVMLVGASRVVCLSPAVRDQNLAAPRGSPRGDSTSRDARPSDGDAPTGAGDVPDTGFMLRWGVTVLILLTVGRLALIWTDAPRFFAYAYYILMTTAICWLIGFAVFGLSWGSTGEQPDQPSRSVSTAIAFGLFAFVLHDMINFATFVPATATTLFTLLAVCIAQRSASDAAPIARTRVGRWLPFGLATGGIVFVVGAGAVPVARAGHHLERAREAGRQIVPAPVTAQTANAEYDRAVEADPLDPTPCVEKARWLMALSAIPNLRYEAHQLAAEALARGADRDPFSAKLPRMQMQLYLQKALTSGDPEDYLAAIDAGRRALELYPRDPNGLAMLGDVQLESGEATRSDQLLRDAIASYERALRLDDRRLAWEELNRLREKDKLAIQSNIQRAEDLLFNRR